MSTNPVLVPVSLVSQFLANEKMASRHWLQCQMECLLDQVFDQLSTKFEDYLASNAITGTAHHTTIDTDPIQHQLRHEPQHELPFGAHSHPQLRATTDHMINTEFPVSVGQSQIQSYLGDYHVINSGAQMNLDRIDSEALMHDKPPYPLSICVQTSNQGLLNQHYTNEEYGLAGDVDQSPDYVIDAAAARMDSDEPVVKKGFDDTNHELITKNQISSSLSAPSSNQSNHNLTNDENEDEDDCDCDDCRNGIEVKEEDEDDDDVQIIEDDDEYSRPAKIPRMDTTESYNRQLLVTRESSSLVSSNQTDQVQSVNEQTGTTEETDEMNNQDKRIITISLQCLKTDCPLMFNNKTELNAHMSTQHDILPHQCLVKDCKQSFSKQNTLKRHINQVHPNTTQWHCDKCPRYSPTYLQLYKHNYLFHQPGQYKCIFANCTFTEKHRQKVFNHFKIQHKPTVEFICQHPNCARRFNNKFGFDVHKRVHLGIKPYLCKWPSCGYAATDRPNAIAHIKRMHLTPNEQTNEQPLAEPSEYLEVLHNLL